MSTPITPLKAPALADLLNALQLAVTYGDKEVSDAEAKQALGRIRGLMDAQRAAFEYANRRFPDPSVCEGCGYPLTSHPRTGCAFVDGCKP